MIHLYACLFLDPGSLSEPCGTFTGRRCTSLFSAKHEEDQVRMSSLCNGDFRGFRSYSQAGINMLYQPVLVPSRLEWLY